MPTRALHTVLSFIYMLVFIWEVGRQGKADLRCFFFFFEGGAAGIDFAQEETQQCSVGQQCRSVRERARKKDRVVNGDS